MTTPNESNYDLLTEHFGYPPVSLLDDIINTVNVLADRALDSVERVLLSLPPQNLGFKPSKSKDASGENTASSPEEAAKREIENGTHQLETLLNAAIDKNFDIFELYTMNNILTIDEKTQPFIRLSHYQGLDLSKHPDRPTAGSITELRRRLRASQKLHVALEAERTRNDVLLRRLKEALNMPFAGGGQGPVKKEPEAGNADEEEEEEEEEKRGGGAFGFLRDKGTLEQGGTDRPITTTAEFTLSQLQSLRSLSSSLRALLPQLGTVANDPEAAAADPNSDSEDKSWRRERSEYIESASRKYLERSAGLELGPHGEVRDGVAWQGGGPSLAKGEVESLEKVAAILATNTAAAGSMDAGKNSEDDAMEES